MDVGVGIFAHMADDRLAGSIRVQSRQPVAVVTLPFRQVLGREQMVLQFSESRLDRFKKQTQRQRAVYAVRELIELPDLELDCGPALIAFVGPAPGTHNPTKP